MKYIILLETRLKCIRAWVLTLPFPLLLMIVQTLSGKLRDIELAAWSWWALVSLPSFALLLLSLFINRHPAKIIAQGVHVALVSGTWCYSILVLLTLLIEPFARQWGQQSTMDHLQTSCFWLAPLHVLLLGSYYLVFWRKESLFRPNEKIILEVAAQEAAKSRPLLQKQVFDLMAANEVPEVFRQLGSYFEKESPDGLQTLTLLQSEYTAVLQERDLNLVDLPASQRQLNRIAMALLNLATQVRD